MCLTKLVQLGWRSNLDETAMCFFSDPVGPFVFEEGDVWRALNIKLNGRQGSFITG